jgi:carbamoyltransferase
MKYIGLSCGFHDAGLSVVDDNGNILFAGHSERYSKHKHDKDLCGDIAKDALQYISNDEYQLHYYEKPWLKAIRQLRAGQRPGPFSMNELIGPVTLEVFNNKNGRVKTHHHHKTHAAAGFQTSPFKTATCVVIDAIGELDTISIWHAWYDSFGVAHYKKLWSKSYPDSIGLMYSAMTQRVELRPLDEEYILMGMAAYGKPIHADAINSTLLENKENLDFKLNLHTGVGTDFLPDADYMDIASSTQVVTEELIKTVMQKAKELGKSKNLVYGGGVALNCLANRLIGNYFNNIWIMPNPGDAGNSLGAAALGYGKKLKWKNAFLGYNISGSYPVLNLFKELKNSKIVGVASGRAEFGPRALGNRSLLADPRGEEIKDKVNEIKRRQKFRPFAPIILEEHVHKYFDMPRNWHDSRYMQVIATCRRPDLFPAIVHADGTSRVQTVPKDGSGIRQLLELWYSSTKCPMLLNTSLNIRGEPMVNDRSDADRFEKLYGVKVIS